VPFSGIFYPRCFVFFGLMRWPWYRVVVVWPTSGFVALRGEVFLANLFFMKFFLILSARLAAHCFFPKTLAMEMSPWEREIF